MSAPRPTSATYHFHVLEQTHGVHKVTVELSLDKTYVLPEVLYINHNDLTRFFWTVQEVFFDFGVANITIVYADEPDRINLFPSTKPIKKFLFKHNLNYVKRIQSEILISHDQFITITHRLKQPLNN